MLKQELKIKSTHPPPSFTFPNRNTWMVPLSLQTQISLSSFLNATPKISARSAPLRSSRARFPVCEFQIRTRVPLEDVVASIRPDGGTVIVVNADSWAIMISLGLCACVAVGRFRAVEG